MSELHSLPKPLVGVGWLLKHLGAADLKLIDASWRMPGMGDARAAYAKAHIPGAVFFPIDEIADRSSDLPHMLPSPAQFEKEVGALGVSHRDRVVIYDDQGLFSSARVWWTFRAMGHAEVTVLDGGLPAWIAHGGAVSAAPSRPGLARYGARFNPDLVADHVALREGLAMGAAVLDARPAGRFAGREAEPRAGLLSGAMPGARNIPVSAVVENGRLRPVAELAAIFAAAGAGPDRRHNSPVFTTCGSGVTAAILSLAQEALGRPPARLYDGAWAEWGRARNDRALFPVVAGAQPVGP